MVVAVSVGGDRPPAIATMAFPVVGGTPFAAERSIAKVPRLACRRARSPDVPEPDAPERRLLGAEQADREFTAPSGRSERS